MLGTPHTVPCTSVPSADLSWADRTFAHGTFALGDLVRDRDRSVSVCLPARDEAATIAPIVRSVVALRDAGLVDQVVVVDDSQDGTAQLAADAGAEVHDQSSLMAGYGPVRGKGDAMWRALSVVHGDLVVFLDADTEDFAPHFVTGLLGPLLRGDGRTRFVKATYGRPWRTADSTLPEGGGRVTELTARPLLRRCFPALSGLRQPLAGEIAATRNLLEDLPFRLGYGVDAALLIDALRVAGPAGLAQVDLGTRQNRHQPLHALHHMACEVGDAILDRAAGVSPRALERPALASLASPVEAAS
jgi:glucosyl-3-phosphoglycerate synthase